jgi:hypothetical protein
MREHPEMPAFASSVGVSLHNLATLDFKGRHLEKASERLQTAVKQQRKALDSNPRNAEYRKFLNLHLVSLSRVARALGDSVCVSQTESEIATLRDSDPALAALEARLAAVGQGDQQPRDETERLQLAQRAYDKALYPIAARLWSEALLANPQLGDDRQAQHRYNAACAAALAVGTNPSQRSRVEGEDRIPDDAAKAELRTQALQWLKAELATWNAVLASDAPKQNVTVARTLAHWKQDIDLASIRDERDLADLPEAERVAWQALWAEVEALQKRAEGPTP